MMQNLLERLKRLIITLGIWVLAALLLFEEWGWDRLSGILAWLGKLPGLRWIEAHIRGLSPLASLSLFAIPVLALLPIKLLALYWLGNGHPMLGIGVIIAAKLGGTAITARLFMLTQAKLMQLPWFARWLGRWLNFKNRVLAIVKTSRAWQQWVRAKARMQNLAKAVAQALRRYWPF